MSETEGARPVVTLELRGRDLALTPPAAWWSRDDDDLYAALFGQSEAGGAALLLRRDLPGRCLRAPPLDFPPLPAPPPAHAPLAVPARLHPELLRRFGLLVFDECQHLPAPAYRQIAEGAFTPYRLGLSATPERADLEHVALERLIGPEVSRRQPEELAAAHYLAAYDERRIAIALTPAARLPYEQPRAAYRGSP